MCGLNLLGKKLLEFDQSQNTNVCGLPLKQNLKEFLGEFEFTDNFTLIIIETESGGPDLFSKNRRQHDPIARLLPPTFIFIPKEIWASIGCGLGHYLV